MICLPLKGRFLGVAFDEPFALAARFAFRCVEEVVMKIVERQVLIIDLLEDRVPLFLQRDDFGAEIIYLSCARNAGVRHAPRCRLTTSSQNRSACAEFVQLLE